MSEPVTTFVVHRFDPASDPTPYWETFEVPRDPDYTILDGLFYIQNELDPTLAFRCACRNWMCGSCGVRVNGRARLGCKTPLRDLPAKVSVEPMRNLPVVKDLVTDMAPFFDKWRAALNAFVPAPDAPEEPIAVRPDARGRIDTMLECITCGLCYSACRMVGSAPGFLGPAALTRAYCLVEDTRDAARTARLRVVASEDGVFRCHGHGDCQDVCPKELSPTRAIGELKWRAVWPWTR